VKDTAEAVIIGAGIMGCAIAHALAARGSVEPAARAGRKDPT
jgi:glycine/D-amino acid oxidase-like deaminating enzyme